MVVFAVSGSVGEHLLSHQPSQPRALLLIIGSTFRIGVLRLHCLFFLVYIPGEQIHACDAVDGDSVSILELAIA